MERHPAPDSIDALVGHAAGRRRGTIVVVDVVESVRLMEQDEAGAVARWQALAEAIVHGVLPGTGGRLVKSLGDGMMLDFPDTRRAVAAAFAIQQACSEVNGGVADPRRRMWVRIGAHVGEHLVDARDVYGHSVNLAARLTTVAGPGEIVVSAEVRDQVTDTLDAQIEDLGDCWLKHVSEPVRVYRLGPPGPEPTVEPAAEAHALRPTVAVIPFAARACHADEAVLGEIIADEVIGALSRSTDVDVISRLTTSALRGLETSPALLAERLGATYVLYGHYRVSGARVIVAAELCHARSAKVVWSDTLRASTASVIWGEAPLFEHLVDAVRSALVATALQRVQTQALPTLESFNLLMAAIALMHRQSPSDYERARRALELVIDRAPRQAIPRAWLAKWHVLRLMQGWTYDPAEDAQAALDATRHALDLDPECSLALAIDGLVQTHFTKRLDIARQRFEGALAANPNDSLAWLLKGMLHAFRGEGRDALHDSRRALKLSPLDPLKYYYDSLAASAAVAGGEPARAIELAQRSLKANRRHTSTLRALAIAQWQVGRHEDARVSIAELRRLEPELTVSMWRVRSPSAGFPICDDWASVLSAAGLPP
jgi:class 3 adenylate cyclase/TolB-like protein/Tfp pilus assembly protein PilF